MVKSFNCIDCGKILSKKTYTRCRSCDNKIRQISNLTRQNMSNAQKHRFSKQEELQKISSINHHNWKGGITPLSSLIRNSIQYKDFVKKILFKDNYTCKKCSDVGKKLQVHHLIPFSTMLQQFLKEYDQFSPIEDKETLLRLATKYELFWDETNVKTLCIKCHKQTDSYLHRHGKKF